MKVTIDIDAFAEKYVEYLELDNTALAHLVAYGKPVQFNIIKE